MDKQIFIRLSEEASDFIQKLPTKAKIKVLYTIDRVREGYSNSSMFKKLAGTDIWEFRVSHSGISYRLLSFWDTESNSLVIVTHGFSKKTQKTPANEIAKAERYRQTYFTTKQG